MRISVAWFMCFAVALLFCGCAPMAVQNGMQNGEVGNVIGILRVSGPNVFHNGAPARDGDRVLVGSTVTTGAGSSARVEFTGGGYLQMDQNTDPIFEWVEQSKCILVRIFRGQAYLKRERACVEAPNLALVLNSEANFVIQPEPRLSEVTLIQGSAQVTVPERITLQPGQQLAVSQRRIAALRQLSPAELRSIAAWRGSYRFRPLPAPEPEDITIRPRPEDRTPAEPAPPAEPATPAPPTETPQTPPTGPPDTPPKKPPTVVDPNLKIRTIDKMKVPEEPVIR